MKTNSPTHKPQNTNPSHDKEGGHHIRLGALTRGLSD